MIVQQKSSVVPSTPDSSGQAGRESNEQRRNYSSLWQQVRYTHRGRFTLLAICILILSLAQAFFIAHSFQQVASDLHTISDGSIPGINAARAIASYIEDANAKAADYLASGALTNKVPCQIIGSNNAVLLTAHDCDDRTISADIIAANHQLFLAAHNATYPGEQTAIERIIAGIQDYSAQIAIIRQEYGLAANKSDAHDPHLQLARQAYNAANTILTTHITSEPPTGSMQEKNLPDCTVAGRTAHPDQWVTSGIRTNIACLSAINKAHLDATYTNIANFLSPTIIVSIISSLILILLISGTTGLMIFFTHRIINVGLTLAMLISIATSIAVVARLTQAVGQHGDTQGTLTLYIFLSAILFPLAGLLAAGGIVQRLKEF